jgi:hypothetical protein
VTAIIDFLFDQCRHAGKGEKPRLATVPTITGTNEGVSADKKGKKGAILATTGNVRGTVNGKKAGKRGAVFEAIDLS